MLNRHNLSQIMNNHATMDAVQAMQAYSHACGESDFTTNDSPTFNPICLDLGRAQQLQTLCRYDQYMQGMVLPNSLMLCSFAWRTYLIDENLTLWDEVGGLLAPVSVGYSYGVDGDMMTLLSQWDDLDEDFQSHLLNFLDGSMSIDELKEHYAFELSTLAIA